MINLLGRMFMEAVDCPFRTAEAILAELPEDVPLRLVDFHAEATSEKKALAYFLDGRVTAVCGNPYPRPDQRCPDPAPGDGHAHRLRA